MPKSQEIGKIVKKGKVESEDIQLIKENLSPPEKLKLIAAVPVENGKGKNLTVLTNRRLIFLRKGKFKLLGDHEGFKDFSFESIVKIDTEPRKKFDLFKIELEKGDKEEFMVPKNSGGEIAGIIRNLQTQIKREEERGETPLKKLEKLSKLKEKGSISEKEFKAKKKELLEEI